MSRSYRKTPIYGWSTAESDKEFKKQYNRNHRRRSKKSIDNDEYDMLINNVHKAPYADYWNSPKDGKQYFPMMDEDEFDNHRFSKEFKNYESYLKWYKSKYLSK